jgi:hypothetical protein
MRRAIALAQTASPRVFIWIFSYKKFPRREINQPNSPELAAFYFLSHKIGNAIVLTTCPKTIDWRACAIMNYEIDWAVCYVPLATFVSDSKHEFFNSHTEIRWAAAPSHHFLLEFHIGHSRQLEKALHSTN